MYQFKIKYMFMYVALDQNTDYFFIFVSNTCLSNNTKFVEYFMETYP